MKVKYLAVGGALLFRSLLGLAASAAVPGIEGYDSDYYRIGKESVAVAAIGSDAVTCLPTPATSPIASKQTAVALGIINAGATAWKVISKGAPSAEAGSSYASAIPPGMSQNWSAVAEWKGPKGYLYTYTVKNLMGIEVIRVQYEVAFYYGGTKPGTGTQSGSYIANFTVKPVDIHIKWGWHFDLQAGISHPMNIGSVAEPVGFLMADLKWRVFTMLEDKSKGKIGIWSYSVDGKGNFTDLTEQQKELTKQITPLISFPKDSGLSWN